MGRMLLVLITQFFYPCSLGARSRHRMDAKVPYQGLLVILAPSFWLESANWTDVRTSYRSLLLVLNS
jgi:hypothetical protein